MTALLCPGQGAQFVGMGRDVAERFPVARAMFDRADEALGIPLSTTLFEGPEADVHRTDICQPGILTVTAAIIEVLRARGLVTDAELTHTAGLSLGEYTAHYVAGTLQFEDAVRLVRARGEAMQAASDATPSGMAAIVGLREGVEGVTAVCNEVQAAGGCCVVANLNAPGQVVISGENGALDQAIALLEERGARRVVRLTVAGAFHSPVMNPAAARLEEELANVTMADPRIPVISNVTAEPITTAAAARETLGRQVVSPVLFEKSLRLLVDAEVNRFIEPGPGRTLTAFLRKIDRRQNVSNYETAADLEADAE